MATRLRRSTGLRTREVLLESARQLFLRQGYHATGMRQIAQETGISLSAVYNHFSSKEEIFEALLVDNNLYAAMAEGLSRATGETTAELMQSGFTEIMAALGGKEDYMLLVFIDVLEFQARHVARLAGESIPRILHSVQRIAQLGRERGELREVSPVLLGRAYIQLVFSSFILENVVKVFATEEIRAPLRAENWEQGLMDILLHGVLKQPPGAEGG